MGAMVSISPRRFAIKSVSASAETTGRYALIEGATGGGGLGLDFALTLVSCLLVFLPKSFQLERLYVGEYLKQYLSISSLPVHSRTPHRNHPFHCPYILPPHHLPQSHLGQDGRAQLTCTGPPLLHRKCRYHPQAIPSMLIKTPNEPHDICTCLVISTAAFPGEFIRCKLVSSRLFVASRAISHVCLVCAMKMKLEASR